MSKGVQGAALVVLWLPLLFSFQLNRLKALASNWLAQTLALRRKLRCGASKPLHSGQLEMPRTMYSEQGPIASAHSSERIPVHVPMLQHASLLKRSSSGFQKLFGAVRHAGRVALYCTDLVQSF